MKKLALFMIAYYRQSGGGKKWFQVECNYEPSCSEYTYNAISALGFFRGVYTGFKRIKSCSKRDTIYKCIDPFIKEDTAKE